MQAQPNLKLTMIQSVGIVDMLNGECPVCKRQAANKLIDSKSSKSVEATLSMDLGNYHVKCSVCGEYYIGYRVTRENKYQNESYRLSGILREASEHGNPHTVTVDNIDEILSLSPVPDNPFEKIDRILTYIYKKSNTDADFIKINDESDYPIAYAKNQSEFRFYLMKGIELGYLEDKDKINGQPLSGSYRLNLKGWERVAELEKRRVKSGKAFVAMWFPDKKKEETEKENMDKAYKEGFEAALSSIGYKKPFRVDLIEHNDSIPDRIIAEIRKSCLLIADFTGNREGVYFEAGLAMGLGIPVIWTCREDFLAKLHFDIKHFNHIVWNTSEDLKEKLINRIEATLPNRVRKH